MAKFLIACVYTNIEIWKSTNCMNLQFAPGDKVVMVMKDDNWCQTLGQFTGAHFPELNLNCYDINNTKSNLNVSTKAKLNANDQSFGLKTKVITGSF